MKKALKIFGIIVLLLLVALIAVPYFYKDEINAYIKEDINKNFNAKIDYKDVSLSLIKDFPNLHVQIKDISIDGVDDFKNTSLAYIQNLSFSLDARKVFFDKDYEITRMDVDALDLNLLVLKNGRANYDILKKQPNNGNPETEPAFEFKLKEYEFSKAIISYVNQENGMEFHLEDLNHTGSGIFTDKAHYLKTQSDVAQMSFLYGIPYINKAKIQLKSDVVIEDDFSKYSFKNNEAYINDLDIEIEKAEVRLDKDDVRLDIAYKTVDKQLKDLLSLVPKTYLEPVADIETNGTASLSGYVKGIYNEKTYPAYVVNLDVDKGYVKYPDLPEALRDVNVKLQVKFEEGSNLDNTQIDLSKIHFAIADNQVDGFLQLENPMTDPLINTSFQSNLELGKLKDALKLRAVNKLRGMLDSDFKIKGRLSAIEQKKYQDFQASGFFNLKDFSVQSDSIPYDIQIAKANFDITPQALQMKEMHANIGDNDFHLQGELSNYIAYFLKKDEVLKADFTMHSKRINLNDFMTEESEEKAENSGEGIIRIPANIDLKLTADVDNLIYKNLDLKEAKGELKIKDEKADLKAVLLKTLEGQMELNGLYDSSQEEVLSRFDVNMNQMSITKSASSLSFFKAYAPILQKINGKFFSNMQFDVKLDDQMNPILNSLKAQGDFNTESLTIQGIDIVTKIGSLLKIKALENPNIDKLRARFTIDKGRMRVKPFGFQLNDMQATLGGNVTLEKQIDFVLSLDVPREKLGTNPNAILEGLVGKLADLGLKTDLGDIIKMKFRIKGDYNHPTIVPAIAGYEGASTQEIIQEVIEDKVEEAASEAVEQAREEARTQADKILEQAQQQADSLVSAAQKLSFKIKQEAQVQADALIDKAQNPLEKIGAKAAAKKINQQAEKKGNLLVEKAQEKAHLIMQKAQERADKLINTEVNTQLDKAG